MTRHSIELLLIALALTTARPISAQSEVRGNDFEGVYQVGTTTCVVAPAKMAFEVRWHGKAKPEYYFYNEAKSVGDTIVFEADPDYNDGIAQSFVFDSILLDRGIFVRADGKRLAVTHKGKLP
jgi:hypothetical protein